ncbi:EcsC family protein [Neobacillus sp. PS2-9]|uniref:EcsC family protein n=1 Tax=Neobacillus sp. PS2-9 TaxID=3070676 RepID=UPI0027DECA99|nr:EcsC family protein [Neobacillus sp. PS2-9]WML57231.1 EcsC family protein [Neobacillus sp. PS2-9]
MNEYELKVYDEVEEWKRKLSRRSGMMNRISKKAQVKINEWIPDKVHEVMTESIKGMVKATLFGSKLTTKKDQAKGLTLSERDEMVRKKIATYQKTAIVEGAGTGAGGILLGLADFPLLLTIKMKFLFEAAEVYGFNTNQYEERLFILHIFQLAFSSDDIRRSTLYEIENWEERKQVLVEMDWRKFQQEYRDYIDLAKMLQLVPGIGAFVGAYANNNLLKHLGETAMNAYRLRLLQKAPE